MIGMIPVLEIIRNDRSYNACDIQQRHHGSAGLLTKQYFEKILLECDAKRIKRDHVEQEMHEICMQSPMCDQSMPLALSLHPIWPEEKILPHLLSVEGKDGNDAGDNDDQKCDAHG